MRFSKGAKRPKTTVMQTLRVCPRSGFAPTPRERYALAAPSAGRPVNGDWRACQSLGTVWPFTVAKSKPSVARGASAVAGAAYRAGLDVTDLRTGERHDYTRKSGVVVSGILAPADAPDWAQDPAQLWNAAEAAETRKNSVVAREFLVSLPHELTDEQRADLARDLTAHLVDRFGFAAMFAIHAPDKKSATTTCTSSPPPGGWSPAGWARNP